MSLQHSRGFTLLEIIITLTTLAVLATMIVTYFGSAFLESATPITRLRNAAALHRIMENIKADCNIYPRWRSGSAYTAGTYIVPTNFNGRYYKCTTAGTSDAAEPDWPMNSGATKSDGTVTWTLTESIRLRVLLPLATLQSRVGPEGTEQTAKEYSKNPDGVTYTKFTVLQNRFIQFTANTEVNDTTGANKILKVTLQNDQGNTLTALFYSD